MNKVVFLLFAVLCCLPLRLGATAWTPDNLPMVHLQDARRFVCNLDGVLASFTVDSIDVMLARLERETGVETVVVVVKRLEGGDAYRFGIDLGRKYGVGDKEKRTGLVVVLSTEDRTYQILTGYGLEGTLPDAICRRVENRVMVPLLKQGKWDAAMLETMRALDTYIRRDGSLRPGTADKDGDRSAWMALPVALVFLIILIGVFSLAGHKKTRRCPRCHRYLLGPVSRRRYRDSRGRWKMQTVWQCAHCGYREVRDEDAPPPGIGGGMFVPPIIMGGDLGHGFGGGGGITGGSFGGGDFGGGGSGGDF